MAGERPPPKRPKPKFKLLFEKRALDEWRKLDSTVQSQFKKKLTKLIMGKEIPSPQARLSGLPADYYKIKQRKSGYRLVFRYENKRVVILVMAVGKRNRNIVYDIARGRIINR